MRKIVLVLGFVIIGLTLSAVQTFAANVKINEFVPNAGTEWVEFYNPDHADLTGYFIDDDTDFGSDSGSSKIKNLQSLNATDSAYPYIELPSAMFNNSGDNVVLFGPDGGLVDHYSYSDDPGQNVSIGRSPDGYGDFAVLVSSTQGVSNTAPKPSPTSTPAPTAKPTPTTKPSSPTPSPRSTSSLNSTNSLGSSSSSPTGVQDSSTYISDNNSQLYHADSISASGSSSINLTGSLSGKTKPSSKPHKTAVLSDKSSSFPWVAVFIISGILFLTGGIVAIFQIEGREKVFSIWRNLSSKVL